MTRPPWPARRVGQRVLCGRMVDGQYVCQGELARIEVIDPLGAPLTGPQQEPEPPSFWWPFLESGAIESPAGHVRLRKRAASKVAEGRQPVARRRGPRPTAPPPPWTRQCPHCNVLAVVDVPACPAGPWPLRLPNG